MTEVPRPDGRPAFKLGPEIKMRMGQQLRVMYGDVMNQGVPDSYNGLLKQFDALDEAAE
jgi:Anti-sigma factor NepR